MQAGGNELVMPLLANTFAAIRLRAAQEEASNVTVETAAARLSPEEALRLSRVRNIGIAVCPTALAFISLSPLTLRPLSYNRLTRQHSLSLGPHRQRKNDMY